MQNLVTPTMRVEEGDQRSRDHEALRHFVNSDEPDPHVVFDTERGQIRPRGPGNGKRT